MSAFSLYGCFSVTSGAMLRKDPVWPACRAQELQSQMWCVTTCECSTPRRQTSGVRSRLWALSSARQHPLRDSLRNSIRARGGWKPCRVRTREVVADVRRQTLVQPLPQLQTRRRSNLPLDLRGAERLGRAAVRGAQLVCSPLRRAAGALDCEVSAAASFSPAGTLQVNDARRKVGQRLLTAADQQPVASLRV